MLHFPNAHATIRGNSSCQNTSPCDPGRSLMTTSAPASRSASATQPRSGGRTALACRRRGTCAESSSALQQAVGNPRPVRRRRSHRRPPDVGARWRARALHSPRHRTPRCGWRQHDSETRPHPPAYALDEEPLVRGDPPLCAATWSPRRLARATPNWMFCVRSLPQPNGPANALDLPMSAHTRRDGPGCRSKRRCPGQVDAQTRVVRPPPGQALL